MRGLSSCQDSHIYPISVLICQRTNENVYSLNSANQVTMCCDLSCYRVFHCSLTPSFVLLGVSVKSRCFRMLTHSSSLSRQAKMVIFISKITISKTYPILHFVPMRTYNILYCPKKERYYCHLACHNQLYPSRWLLVSTNYRLARWCT